MESADKIADATKETIYTLNLKKKIVEESSESEDNSAEANYEKAEYKIILYTPSIHLTLHAPSTHGSNGEKMKRPLTKEADTVKDFDTGYLGVMLRNEDNDDGDPIPEDPATPFPRDNDDKKPGAKDDDLVAVLLELNHDYGMPDELKAMINLNLLFKASTEEQIRVFDEDKAPIPHAEFTNPKQLSNPGNDKHLSKLINDGSATIYLEGRGSSEDPPAARWGDQVDQITLKLTPGGDYKEASSHGLLLAAELLTDLDNDGAIARDDSVIRETALESGASEVDKDKGTEFLFYNDQLSNGLWDKEDNDPDKPANQKEDDDAQEIKIKPGITQGEVWLEHPAITGLSFYKTRECNIVDKINLSPDNKFTVSTQNPFPEKLFVRADGELNFPENNPQIEGDLVLNIKLVTGQDIKALKLKFTVVKEFGAKKFFHTVDDYIRENNTKLCVVKKTYGADVFRMVFMLEGYTRMFPIDASRRPGGGQLKGIGAVITAYPSTVTINGNQCFFIDERNPYLAGLAGEITDRCHGRVVRFGILDQLVSSDAHLPAHGSPFSPLAGPEPMPDGSRGGNYFTEWAAGNYGIGASVLPSSSTNNAANPVSGMGGLSANFTKRQSDGNEVQAVGYYNKTGVETEGIIFTASTEQGSGRAKDLADDAKRSGVKGLSGGLADELELLFLDGSSSVALAYSKGGAGIKTVIEGGKHTGIPYYYINTYLIFESWETR